MQLRPLHTLLRSGACCLVLVAAPVSAADPQVPGTFLRAQGKLREVLQTPVSGSFHARPASEVIAALCRQLPANNVYQGDTSKRAPLSFTGTFKGTPLRIALFRVARATHITVEWAERPDGGRLISVHE